MTSANGGNSHRLWAITSYFNPVAYKSRSVNYRIFRERLGVPLLTVELAYGPEFDLEQGDADILIQLRGGDLLWQKERLLNIALDALPAECTKVAWIDCDLLFDQPDWSTRASGLLDSVTLIQLFSHVHYLRAGADLGILSAETAVAHRTGLAFAIASGLDAEYCLEEANNRSVGRYSTGLAWAARLEFLQRHRFYDSCIIGGGDRTFVCAAYGVFDHLIRRQRLNDRQFAHFLEWGKPLHDAVRGVTGFVEADLFHLWHGALENRRYYHRYDDMPPFRFDPFEDIALNDRSLWRWNSDKPALHAYVREHFLLRREDG